jgi:hypothetical protein
LIKSLIRKLKLSGLSRASNDVPQRNLLDIPLPGMAAPGNWHVNFIEHIAAITSPKVYVELGLYECELFNRIEPYAERLIGVDMRADVEAFMIKSPKVRFVNSTTDGFVKSLTPDSLVIDLLFIDADHSREAVWRDFWNFLPFVADHGLILLHDAYPGEPRLTAPAFCGDGYNAIYELSQQREQFELVTLPVSPGLAICRKRRSQLSWQQ